MQSSNSSDALLMNIFSHPMVLKWKGVKDLLSVHEDSPIEYGWKASFANENTLSPTEVDMKIGNNLFEAKLTETDFTDKDQSVVEGYGEFQTVFNTKPLIKDGMVANYQLIRNILAAKQTGCTFTVLLDETRTDLIRSLMFVRENVIDPEFREKIKFVTWQEIVACAGADLKEYIEGKYF